MSISVSKNEQEDIKDLLTLRQVSTFSKIPLPTIRKYLQEFKGHIPLQRGKRNACLLPHRSVKILLRIKSLYQEGEQRSEILKALTIATVIDSKDDIDIMVPSKSSDSALVEASKAKAIIHKLNIQYQELAENQVKVFSELKHLKEGLEEERKQNQKLEKQLEEANKLLEVQKEELVSVRERTTFTGMILTILRHFKGSDNE